MVGATDPKAVGRFHSVFCTGSTLRAAFYYGFGGEILIKTKL